MTAPPPLRIVPERSLGETELASYGRETVGGLIADLAAEDGDSPAGPTFLVNGKRVSGLDNVADLPAEAIVKIDILPVGSGLKLGAGSAQRVYDIQLRRELDLAAAGLDARMATSGKWSSLRGDLAYSHIRGERRITLAAKIRDEQMLLEDARGIVQPAGTTAGAGRFRSLLPAGDRIDLSIAGADALSARLSVSAVSKLSFARRHSTLGPFAPAGLAVEPLDQRRKTVFASTDLTLNAQLGDWQVALFGTHVYQSGRSSTERLADDAEAPLVAATRSINRSLGGRVTVLGSAVELPAGPVTLNLGAGVTRDRFEGRGGLQGAILHNATTLRSTSLTAALDVPIASKAAAVLAGLGELSASVELGRQHVSDFGSFNTYAFSFLWRPFARFSLAGSLSRSDSAPPAASLDEPAIETPGTRYFDPLRGETVDVILVSGGAPGLRRQSDESRRLAANYSLFRPLGLRLNAEYFESRNRDFLSELPSAGLAILRAFPERFLRDGNGRLVKVDARPISFAGRMERQVRAGFILNLPLGARKPGRAMVEDEDGSNDSRSGTIRSGARPRLQIAATYSRLLRSELRIAAGQPAINLLSAKAVGFGGLGRPRNRFDASLSYAESGMGLRLSLQSRGASLIEASGGAANPLRFYPLTTFGLRGWIQGERLAPRSQWMKGAQLSLTVLNATDRQERVADRLGATPLNYQRGYRDPIGRSLEITLRKKF